MDEKRKAVINLLNIVYGIALEDIEDVTINCGAVFIDYADGSTGQITLMDTETFQPIPAPM